MSLRAKFAVLTAALVGTVVAALAATVIRAQHGALEAESRERLETLMDGVARIAQESLDAGDELMLVSYLKHLRRERPELALAMVARRGRTTRLGREAAGLVVLSRTAVERVPVTYTVKAYPSQPAAPAEVSVSSAGLSLSVRGDAFVKMTQEKKPEVVQVSLGFLGGALAAEVDRRLRPMIGRTAALAAAFMALGVLGALAMAQHLTSPLIALAAAAGAVGRGRLDTTVAEDRRDEVGVLERRFNEMTGSIKELMRFREDILHALTHELNTPLSGLKGYLEMWQDKKLPPEAQAAALETMTAAVLRMENSLGNALSLFKGAPGEAAGPRRLVWVDDIVGQVLALLAPVARAKRIAVRPLPPDATECLYADEERLRQIVMNLVSNAIKYTPEGGEVRVALEGTPGEVRLLVSDTGCGIRPEDVPHIFTKFYRGEPGGSAGPSSRVPGSGLGLSIAHKAAESLGGNISVESEPGRGSTFLAAIPRRPAGPAQGSRR